MISFQKKINTEETLTFKEKKKKRPHLCSHLSSSGRSLCYGYVNFITPQEGNYPYQFAVFSHCRSVTFSLFVLSLPMFGSLESFEKQNKSKFLEWIGFALFWIMTIQEHKS